MIKLSVIIPLYNKEKYIKETLNSIVSQIGSYDVEVIIIDDGSTDNSINMVKSFIEENFKENIKLFCYENKGVSVARNRGIKSSSGNYLVFIDADDIMHNGFINDIYDTILRVSGSFAILGYNYSKGKSSIVPLNYHDGYINYFDLYLKYGPPFCSSSVIINKSELENDYNLFPEGEWIGEDIYAWSRMILRGGRVYYRNFVASEYRMEANSAMSKKKDEIKLIRNDSDLHSTDKSYNEFIIYHKKDFLTSCIFHGDYESLNKFLKKESKFKFVEFRLMSLIPRKIFCALLKIKRILL